MTTTAVEEGAALGASAPVGPPAPTASARYGFALVSLFAVGWIVFTAAIIMFNPLLPLIREDFNLSGTQAGLITSIFYLPYLLMQVPSGLLADRLGPKRILVVMTLLCTLALSGIWFLTTSLVLLILFGVLYRAGSGVFYPAAFGITVSTVPPKQRGVSSAALTGGMALGTGVGLAVAVPLAVLGHNWRFPFLVLAGGTLVLAVLFQLVLRGGQRLGAGQAGGFGMALRDTSLWMLFVIGLFTNFGFTVVATWAPSFLNAERGLPLGQAAFYTSLFSFVGFPAGLVCGRLSDRVGRWRLSFWCFILAALSLVALALVHQEVLIVAAILLFGLTGKWAVDGVVLAWVGDRVTARYPGALGSVMGFNNMCRMIGGMLAPVAAGALLDVSGSLSGAVLVAAASHAIAGAIVLLARRT
ncbi:MAG: MFS transporter [Chloroflexi bacterium]|nr:MFS transporter [Chloroflexota bacterium]